MTAMKTMATPISSAWPMRRPCKRNKRSWPRPLAPTKEAMTTIARQPMMTWLTPTMSVSRAAGISTFHSIWRGVQPPMTPASTTSREMPRRPRMVRRAMGGMANRMVAMAPALWDTPTKTATGMR